MGSASRPKPARLAEKLLQIRTDLGLSQTEMLVRLSEADELFRSSVSSYERGFREPPLPILLKYARVAGVYVEALIDDELDLPKKLPSSPKSEGIKRKSVSKTISKVTSRKR
jgi:transcriptional regulator with XRE-family HTH domain